MLLDVTFFNGQGKIFKKTKTVFLIKIFFLIAIMIVLSWRPAYKTMISFYGKTQRSIIHQHRFEIRLGSQIKPARTLPTGNRNLQVKNCLNFIYTSSASHDAMMVGKYKLSSDNDNDGR